MNRITRIAALASVIAFIAVGTACTTHRVDLVTSHDASLYMTTTKTTSYGPLSFLLSTETEQSVTKCKEKETKAGKPLLKCYSVDVTIDGSAWDQ